MKSYLALAGALTVVTGRGHFLGLKPIVTGPALYLDWEDREGEFRARNRALCKGAGIPTPKPGTLFYRDVSMPLHQRADNLEQFIATEGIVMVIIDSVMLARGSGDNYASDTTLRFYEALRQLGPPALLVDHQSWESIEKKKERPYGSVVNFNSLRLMWTVTATPTGNGGNGIRLTMGKSNHFRRQPDLAWLTEFTSDDRTEDVVSARFRQVAAQKVEPITRDEDAPLADRILSRIRHSGAGGLTVAELCDELDKSSSTVRGRLAAQLRGKVRKVGDRWVASEMHEGYTDRFAGDDLPAPF